MSCVFFNCFLPGFFEPMFLIEPEAHQLSRLSFQIPSVSAVFGAGTTGACHHSQPRAGTTGACHYTQPFS